MVIQDEQASFTAPDGCQFCHFRSECPLAAVNRIQDLSGCDMCEEVRRQVGIEIHGRLVDTHYDDSIASLSSLGCMVSLVPTRQALCFMNKYDWAEVVAVGDHDNAYDKMKCEKLGVREEGGCITYNNKVHDIVVDLQFFE